MNKAYEILELSGIKPVDLADIEVEEYSEEQKCYHRESLLTHVMINIEEPNNQYFIIDSKNIPSWVFECKELMNYIRIKSVTKHSNKK